MTRTHPSLYSSNACHPCAKQKRVRTAQFMNEMSSEHVSPGGPLVGDKGPGICLLSQETLLGCWCSWSGRFCYSPQNQSTLLFCEYCIHSPLCPGLPTSSHKAPGKDVTYCVQLPQCSLIYSPVTEQLPQKPPKWEKSCLLGVL